MNKTQNDINLIRKYYNGALSLAEQQKLEERALDDPFLQDAMMGIEELGLQDDTIAELDQKLNDRLNKRKYNLIGFTWGVKQWSIAASLIIFISVLSIYLNQTPENRTIAVSELQKKDGLLESAKTIPDTINETKPNGKTELSTGSLLADNNMMVQSPTKSYSPEEEISVEPLMDHQTSSLDTLLQNKKSIVSSVTSMKSDEIQDISNSKVKLLADNNFSAKQAMSSNIVTAPAQLIKGEVTDIITGNVLPGVQIQNKINGLVTISDVKGTFKLVGNQNDSLEISYIGYEPEVLSAKQNVLLKIQLKPSTDGLSEVAAVGYSQRKENNTTLAGPNGGWHTFRQYLDKNAHLNTNQTGKVIVQFNILKNGKLADFKILKTFSPSASETALKLIKAYNSWHGASNGITQNIKVTVRFK